MAQRDVGKVAETKRRIALHFLPCVKWCCCPESGTSITIFKESFELATSGANGCLVGSVGSGGGEANHIYFRRKREERERRERESVGQPVLWVAQACDLAFGLLANTWCAPKAGRPRYPTSHTSNVHAQPQV